MKRNFDFALAIFVGAFLLFLVQPLIGKFILPWFGGGPGVWTTCLLFFQAMLLAGYTYAHLTSIWLKPRAQVILHLALLALAVVLLPITPSEAGKPSGDADPAGQILWLLTLSLGLPYFVLSATGPLLQQWFCRVNPGVSPYRLYALSNTGSLLALVSYPFWVETKFTRAAQAGGWSVGLIVFGVCCSFCAWRVWRVSGGDTARKPEEVVAPADESPPPGIVQRALWLLLPACASALLLATTNEMCQDVAVIPFLWVVPLALYLLSFIICFDSPRWYRRGPFTIALVAAFAAMVWALSKGTSAPIRWQLVIYSAGLLICCMVCHGELYRLRPGPRHLTGFYLMIAAGGALGGVAVALVAPLVFKDYYELHWALVTCAVLVTGVWLRKSGRATGERGLAWLLSLTGAAGGHWLLGWLGSKYPDLSARWLLPAWITWWSLLLIALVIWVVRRRKPSFSPRWVMCGWMVLGTIILGTALWRQAHSAQTDVVSRSRNFYGTLSVCEYQKDDPLGHYSLLQHGRITHGLQFSDPSQSAWRTTYYNEASGVGLAVSALPTRPRRIGLVGLGTGTLAAYGRSGDYLRIYEINPTVMELASSRFTYLSNSAAQVEVILGDARLSMEREAPQRFDLLALDAFSGDAIPVHLLTREAFEIYARHLTEKGVIAVHVSNRYLDLEPVVLNLARHCGYHAAVISFDEETGADEEFGDAGGWWNYSSTWVLLTRDSDWLKSPEISRATEAAKPEGQNIPLWTDDFTSLYQILE